MGVEVVRAPGGVELDNGLAGLRRGIGQVLDQLIEAAECQHEATGDALGHEGTRSSSTEELPQKRCIKCDVMSNQKNVREESKRCL